MILTITTIMCQCNLNPGGLLAANLLRYLMPKHVFTPPHPLKIITFTLIFAISIIVTRQYSFASFRIQHHHNIITLESYSYDIWNMIHICFQGPARLCRFCLFSILLPITFLCVPLYMRWGWWRWSWSPFTWGAGDDHDHEVWTMIPLIIQDKMSSISHRPTVVLSLLFVFVFVSQVCLVETTRVHSLADRYEASQPRAPGGRLFRHPNNPLCVYRSPFKRCI